ncbi:MAG: hypothetical protein HY962_15355 [Ignavibacteriae bacterium]|nr:hypothetical protein [Ignavibacteriota bacterium]
MKSTKLFRAGLTLPLLLMLCVPVLTAQTETAAAIVRLELRQPDPGIATSAAPAPSLFPESAPEKKSGLLAVVYSLLLPGMGELYAGRFDAGIYPLVAEGVLWTGFGGLHYYSSWVRNDAYGYADLHAGASTEGKDERFYAALGNYRSVREHNAVKLVERNLSALYPEDAASGYAWEWATDAERLTFKDQRISADELSNGASFVALALIANRIWSGVQAALFVRRHNAALDQKAGLFPEFRADVLTRNGRTDGVRFTLQGRF